MVLAKTWVQSCLRDKAGTVGGQVGGADPQQVVGGFPHGQRCLARVTGNRWPLGQVVGTNREPRDAQRGAADIKCQQEGALGGLNQRGGLTKARNSEMRPSYERPDVSQAGARLDPRLRAEPLPLGTASVWGWIVLCGGAILCTVGCSAPLEAVNAPSPAVTTKNISRHC